METIVRKNRVRIRRGKLQTFRDLEMSHQKDFITIRDVIKNVLGENIDVYVFGSFYWGFWDEKSDYDVKLDFVSNEYHNQMLENVINIKNELKNEHNLSVDILILRDKTGVLIQ